MEPSIKGIYLYIWSSVYLLNIHREESLSIYILLLLENHITFCFINILLYCIKPIFNNIECFLYDSLLT